MKKLNKLFILGCIIILFINLFPIASIAATDCRHSVKTPGDRHPYCEFCGKQMHFSSFGNTCSATWTTADDSKMNCLAKTKLIMIFPPESQLTIKANFNDVVHGQDEVDIALGCSNDESKNEKVEERVYEYYRGITDNYKGPTEYKNAKQEYFKCQVSEAEKIQYKEVMVPYYVAQTFYYEDYSGPFKIIPTYVTEQSMVLKHTTIYVDADNFPLALEDVHIDLDGGRLVISGTMNNDKDAWNVIFSSLSGVIVGITGLGTLICIIAMIIQIIRLGVAAGNPMEREKALKGVLWTGIGIAGCSSAALVFGLVYNILG